MRNLHSYESMQHENEVIKIAEQCLLADSHSLRTLAEEFLRVVQRRNDWRAATQRQTPMGSEFTTPESCEAYIQARKIKAHETKKDFFRLKKELYKS